MAPEPFVDSWITFGGLNEEYDAQDAEWNSHRIAGSFHWQLKLNEIKYKNVSIRPQTHVILTDTGTTLIYLMPDDYDSIISLLCGDLCDFN
jgi:hypothetical protein